MHNPQGRGVYAVPGKWREQGDSRQIVLLPVTVEDVPQHEEEGGQRDEQHGRPGVLPIQVVIPVPAYHICVPHSGLSSALAGLWTAHRVYQTMSQGTGHLWSEDAAESCEPYVVQLSGPNPHVRKVQMVLVTLPELNGPVPKLMAQEPRVQKVIRRISEGVHRRVRAGPMSLPLNVYDRDAHLRPARCTCGRWACTHKYTDDRMRSPTRDAPIARSTLTTHVPPACVANDVEGTRNCPQTRYCKCMSRSMAHSSVADRWCV